MITFRTNDYDIVFESELIQDVAQKRGEVLTNSVAELKKAYYTRVVDIPDAINVTYMSEANYRLLKQLHRTPNITFEIIDSEGLYFDKCFLTGDLKLTRKPDLLTGSYYRSGTLNVEVR